MNAWPIRVIKVGGSLLTYPPLFNRLPWWLKIQPPAHNVLIVGGGSLVEAIRNFNLRCSDYAAAGRGSLVEATGSPDQSFQLGEKTSHFLCLEMMQVTARLFQALLTETSELAISITRGLAALKEQISTTSAPITTIFDAGEFMQWEEAQFPPAPLPHSWDVTSDSIAARVATLLAAEELVLLKSAFLPECSRLAASKAGYVDRYFVEASKSIPLVRAVNLRSAAFESAILHDHA